MHLFFRSVYMNTFSFERTAGQWAAYHVGSHGPGWAKAGRHRLRFFILLLPVDISIFPFFFYGFCYSGRRVVSLWVSNFRGSITFTFSSITRFFFSEVLFFLSCSHIT